MYPPSLFSRAREDGLEKCAYKIVRREVLIVISPLEYY